VDGVGRLGEAVGEEEEVEEEEEGNSVVGEWMLKGVVSWNPARKKRSGRTTCSSRRADMNQFD